MVVFVDRPEKGFETSIKGVLSNVCWHIMVVFVDQT